MTNKKVFIPSEMKKQQQQQKNKKNATWDARSYHVNVDFVLTSFPSIQRQRDKITARFFVSFIHSFLSFFSLFFLFHSFLLLLFSCHSIWSFAVVSCWFTFKVFTIIFTHFPCWCFFCCCYVPVLHIRLQSTRSINVHILRRELADSEGEKKLLLCPWNSA